MFGLCKRALLTGVLISVFLVGPVALVFSHEVSSRPGTLVIGKISSNPKGAYSGLKAMVNYAAGHMKDLGITETGVLVASNTDQMISYFRQGKVDWITETPASAVLIREKTGAEFLLRNWKGGVSEYHTLLITRKDSDIHDLSDLRGKIIAFEDPGSTSAFFVPASIILSEGMSLKRMYSVQRPPPGESVGFMFYRKTRNSCDWVTKGIVDAAAVSNLDWAPPGKLKILTENKLRVFYCSGPYPRALEIVRKDLSPSIKTRLKDILMTTPRDPRAAEVLKAYSRAKKFDELNEEIWSSLEKIKKVHTQVLSNIN